MFSGAKHGACSSTCVTIRHLGGVRDVELLYNPTTTKIGLMHGLTTSRDCDLPVTHCDLLVTLPLTGTASDSELSFEILMV